MRSHFSLHSSRAAAKSSSLPDTCSDSTCREKHFRIIYSCTLLYEYLYTHVLIDNVTMCTTNTYVDCVSQYLCTSITCFYCVHQHLYLYTHVCISICICILIFVLVFVFVYSYLYILIVYLSICILYLSICICILIFVFVYFACVPQHLYILIVYLLSICICI